MAEPLRVQAVRLVVCPRCQAGLRQPCRTASGARAHYPHAGRYEPLLVGWREGYGEGLQTMLEAAERLRLRMPAAPLSVVLDELRRYA